MSIKLCATLCAGLIATAVAADAAIVKITYHGTVLSGTDDTGTFGTPTSDLTGYGFTVVYTVDDSKGTATYLPPLYSTVGGGSSDNPPDSSPVSADVTINGMSFHIDGIYGGAAAQSAVLNENVAIAESIAFTGQTQVATGYAFSQLFLGSGSLSWDFHTPFFHTVQPGDSANTQAYWQNTDVLSGPLPSWSAIMDVQWVSLTATSVPEPATPAVFAVGFLGAARLRRRTSSRA